ncbi:ABC transporter permease [Streptomyces sp. NPDC056821]|uniref:ABC transporter permease n=1 Tax=unclassified Streptomyces TaxID=2593676 RepID=UPI0036C8CB9D
MIRYLLSRIVLAGALLIGLISLSFGLVSLIPGDPAVSILGDAATPDEIAKVHAQLGLDMPLGQRYLDYLSRTLHGDLGKSYFTGSPITHELLTRVPNTLVLLVPGLLLALLIGVLMGTVSAYRRGRAADKAMSVASAVILAIPEFALALILVFVFFQKLYAVPPPLGMLGAQDVPPPAQSGSVVIDAFLAGSWSTLISIAQHAILPIATLGIFFAAYFAKPVRTGLTQALCSPQVEFARASGLSEITVYRYAMADIRRVLMTYLVNLFGASLSGAAILETVFAWPGIGGWSLDGVLKGDIPVIQGFVLVLGASTIGAYLILDIVITVLDPRMREQAIKPRRHRRTQPQPQPAAA